MQIKFGVARTAHLVLPKQGSIMLGIRLVTPSLLPRSDRHFQTKIKCFLGTVGSIGPHSGNPVSQALSSLQEAGITLM
jgi:hypothetical protein